MTNKQLTETHPYLRNVMLDSYNQKVEFWSKKLAGETRLLKTATESEYQKIQIDRKRSIDALLNAQSNLWAYKAQLATL